jgi:preprotein translocase subunit YajC
MTKFYIVFSLSSLLLITAMYATPITHSNILSSLKEGKEVGCVGVKKVTKTNKEVRIQKNYKVDIALSESGDTFEATEQDSSDLGGYSPIPYPCKFIDGFSSKEFNMTNEKIFYCEDDTYDPTEEIYLLKHCTVYGEI